MHTDDKGIINMWVWGCVCIYICSSRELCIAMMYSAARSLLTVLGVCVVCVFDGAGDGLYRRANSQEYVYVIMYVYVF